MNRAAIIWIVLALVAVTLVAYFAFGRERSEDLMNDTRETADMSAEEIDRGAARAEAQAELTVLQARAEAGETYENLEDEFAEVRADLARAYENAEGAAAEEWAQLNAGFDEFEASARAGTSNFLDAITNLLSRFSADVRVETESE